MIAGPVLSEQPHGLPAFCHVILTVGSDAADVAVNAFPGVEQRPQISSLVLSDGYDSFHPLQFIRGIGVGHHRIACGAPIDIWPIMCTLSQNFSL